jgi:RNA polymerase sigma factor (sigma-70 family)
MKTRVLVVDDDEAIVDGLTSLLQMEDMDCAGACDRLSAGALMTGTFYPVIIADVRLHTEAQGLQLLDDIKRLSPRSRVISITAFSTPELESELRLRGSTSTIQKPASGGEIIAAIGALLAEVELLAAGQEALDLDQLYLDVRKLLYSISLRKYHLSMEEAEDVTQQTWLLFLEKRGLIHTPPAWLAGTVTNLCRRTIDRSKRSRDQFVGVDAIENMADSEAHSPDNAIALDQALAGLDEESRTLCRLIAIEGRPYEEVSAITGLPLGSIGPMYLRSKKKMREHENASSRRAA